MAIVDVIIPTFNAARYLPSALESVISQTFDDWQILLVDDGSTDNTVEVVGRFQDRLGPKLKYIKQENGGVSSARNAAIRASSSEFIALLDADDVWLPCRLSESLKALAECPQAGLSYGLIRSIDPEGRLGDAWAGNLDHKEGMIAPHIYMRTVELPSPSITVRKKCIDEVGVFDETFLVTEDRDLWLRIALKYEVAFVPEVIALYRTSPGSLSTDPNRMLQAQVKFIQKNYGAAGCGLLRRQAALARSYKQQAENLKARGRAWAALQTSLRALALYPLSIDYYRTVGSLMLNWIASFGRS
ncbi:MAG: glycosyltransferase family 2 protein [Acidobacteriota bacterium]|nr:glycosyltransferase family 2 protein [Acidobacteriota bacterium]